jgi:DNA polymerase-1
LLLACWKTHDGTRNHKWGGELDQGELLADIAEHDFIVAHAAKFEAGWLARCGLDLRKLRVYDTYLGEWVIGGNRWVQQDLGLDASLERWGLPGKHPVGRLIRLGVDTESIPKPWLEEYCYSDVDDCEKLFYKQLDVLERDNLLHIQYARCLLVPVLVDMEFQGLTLDPKRVAERHAQITQQYNKRYEELEKITGGINFRSRPQLGEFLYDKLGFEELKGRDKKPLRTGKDARKTDSATLSALKATTKAQREFVECYKDIAKLNAKLTKGFNFFKEICDNHDATFYGVLNQGATATHRLSSSGRPVLVPVPGSTKAKKAGAQLQNIAREDKDLFTTRDPDWLICEADGSGLEFRTGVGLSQDPVGIQDILNGEDVHSITRDVLIEAGKPGMKADGAGRQASKPVTFSPINFSGLGW